MLLHPRASRALWWLALSVVLMAGSFAGRRASAQEMNAANYDAGNQGDVYYATEQWTADWYVQAEALALRIDELGATPLALNVGTGATELTTRGLGYPYRTGPRLTIGRALQSGGALEATYFGLMQWSTSATATSPNNLRLPGTIGLALDDFFGADAITATQQTQLHNVELNLIQRWSDTNLSWLVGFRYVNFSEQVNLHAFDSDGEESDYRVTATNNLVGGQLGGKYDVYWDRFQLTALGKAGVYGAIQNASTLLRDFDNTVVLRNLSVNRGDVAFIGEVGLNGTYFVNDWLALRGGYNVYFLTGIARGTDQFDFTDTPASSTALVGTGGALLHGFNGGVEVRW
jgi:hypothetical protein